MSVAVHRPELLPAHRRPRFLAGGSSWHVLFRIAEHRLMPGLRVVLAEPQPAHAEVQPERFMSILTYEMLLKETRKLWEAILGP
jgi:hypothetical protein